MTQYLYRFGGGVSDGGSGDKTLLGGKGANLAEMASIGLPVPPGFTIATTMCTRYYDEGQTFPTSDSRHKYPIFNGPEFDRNLDFVDAVRPVAARLGCELPDLVLACTMEQPGITIVLFGATSPEQVRENAAAMRCELDDDARTAIREAIRARGPVAGRRAV